MSNMASLDHLTMLERRAPRFCVKRPGYWVEIFYEESIFAKRVRQIVPRCRRSLFCFLTICFFYKNSHDFIHDVILLYCYTVILLGGDFDQRGRDVHHHRRRRRLPRVPGRGRGGAHRLGIL